MNNIPSEYRCVLLSYNELLMEDRGSYFSNEEYDPLPLDFVSKDFYFKTVFRKTILKHFVFLCFKKIVFHVPMIIIHAHIIYHILKAITNQSHHENTKITNKIKTNHIKPFSLMALSHRSILGLCTWFFLHGHELASPFPWSLASGFNSMVLLL